MLYDIYGGINVTYCHVRQIVAAMKCFYGFLYMTVSSDRNYRFDCLCDTLFRIAQATVKEAQMPVRSRKGHSSVLHARQPNAPVFP